MTDLLADQARLGTLDPCARTRCTGATRMVLDTSVLISDPDSHHGLPGRRHGDPAGRGRGARPAQVPARRRRAGRPGGDPRRSRSCASPTAATSARRCRCPTAARCASRPTACTSTRSASTASIPTKNDNRILAASLGQAVHGRTVVVSNDAALRIKAAQLGLEAMEHQRLRGRTGVRAPRRLDHDRGGGRHRRPRLRQPDRHRHRRARRAPTPSCSARELTDRYAVLRAGSQSRPRAPPRRRARAAAAGARAVGAAAALEGAAVRPRPPARPRGAGRRPRRHGRHRQDDPRPRRRPRAGDGGEPLRQGRRVPTGRAGGQGRARVPARHARREAQPVDDRGARRARWPSPSAAATPTPAPCSTSCTEREKLSLEAVTYLRGRSLQGTYVLVDEAQNLEPTTLKTILTRVGEGTKVVFTGDTSQIDAPVPVRAQQRGVGADRRLRRRAVLRPRPPVALRALRGRLARRPAALAL